MRVRYTLRARDDLRAIFEYLFERNPSAARRVRMRIKEAAAAIAHMSEKGRIVVQRKNVRRVLVTRHPYAIYYALTKNIVILHIRHGARKPPRAKDLGI